MIRTRAEVISGRRAGDVWTLGVTDRLSGRTDEVAARTLVNATGPWVSQVGEGILGATADAAVRLVKGSHIVTGKLFDHDRAYIFQNADQRIVFAIPYEDEFTLVGTTDLDYHGDPQSPAITGEEVEYLCAAVSAYFIKPITAADVIHSFAGVRPLYDDGASAAQAATRDYVLGLDPGPGNSAPLLNVYGGKITTYRRLAEAALARLKHWLPQMRPAWTRAAPLPGGDIGVEAISTEVDRLAAACPTCGVQRARRLVRAYGTRARRLVAGIETQADWGRDFGAGLCEREVRYLVENEWALTAEDVLWRRSKLGLHLDAAQAAELNGWMHDVARPAAAPAA